MAFPSTGILDNFNRPDENPVNSHWGLFHPSVNQMRVVSNQLAGQAVGSFNASYWNNLAGPDMEAYATLAVKWAAANQFAEIHARVQSPGGNNLDSYAIKAHNNGTNDIIRLWKQIDTVDTQLGTDQTVTVTAGDRLGISVIGTAVRAWQNGTLVLEVNDSAISGVGFAALGEQDAPALRWEDFGGGTAQPQNLAPVIFGRGAC